MKIALPIAEQIKELKIPYPHKFLLSVEMEEHMHQISASEEFDTFTNVEVGELYDIHNNIIFKFLDGLSPKARQCFELTVLGMPMVAFLIFLIKEDFMFEFIREGGAAMLPILLLGIVLFLRELNLFFRTVVAKDHSKPNLNVDTSSVLIGGFALTILGFGATALGVYVSANGVVAQNLPISIFLTGLKESMGPIIVSAAFTALIFILHFITRRLLVSWKAPILN